MSFLPLPYSLEEYTEADILFPPWAVKENFFSGAELLDFCAKQKLIDMTTKNDDTMVRWENVLIC